MCVRVHAHTNMHVPGTGLRTEKLSKVNHGSEGQITPLQKARPVPNSSHVGWDPGQEWDVGHKKYRDKWSGGRE